MATRIEGEPSPIKPTTPLTASTLTRDDLDLIGTNSWRAKPISELTPLSKITHNRSDELL